MPLAPAVLRGQAATSVALTKAQERGLAVMKETLAALGGTAYSQMLYRVEEGRLYSFSHERLSGLARGRIYTKYGPRPQKPGELSVRERQSFGKDAKDEDYAILFNEDEGVTITDRGLRLFNEEVWTRYVDSTLRNVLYILRQRMEEPGMIFEFQESTTFENQPADVVNITDADNRMVTVHIHKSTRFPIRQEFKRRDAQRYVHSETTYFAKFRKVGNVSWPYNMTRQRDGSKIFEIFSERVSVNDPLSDSLFEHPAGAKRLRAI